MSERPERQPLDYHRPVRRRWRIDDRRLNVGCLTLIAVAVLAAGIAILYTCLSPWQLIQREDGGGGSGGRRTPPQAGRPHHNQAARPGGRSPSTSGDRRVRHGLVDPRPAGLATAVEVPQSGDL